MAPEPREPISEITEISEYQVESWASNIVAAICWGAFAGSVALLGSLVILAGFRFDLGDFLGGLVLVGFFAGAFTVAGMVVIGLPVTIMLHLLEWERLPLYTALGGIAGFLVLALLVEWPAPTDLETFLLPASGALAGFASSYRWGRWRERVAKARQAQREELATPKRPNPIHDLIH